MCQLAEQLAGETGINVNDVNYIFTVISEHLSNKIPALSQVMDAVFENENTDKLQEHLNNAIKLIQQQQWQEKFKDWTPLPTYIIHQRGDGSLF
jgi:hypothetical protein